MFFLDFFIARFCIRVTYGTCNVRTWSKQVGYSVLVLLYNITSDMNIRPDTPLNVELGKANQTQIILRDSLVPCLPDRVIKTPNIAAA